MAIVQDDRLDSTASVAVCALTTQQIEAPLIRLDVEPTATTGIERPSQIMIGK